MQTHDALIRCHVRDSFRVQQLAGMFGMTLATHSEFAVHAELPTLDEDWTIGAIVGPSGSGKSTLAAAAYGAALWRPRPWPRDRAVIDAFPAAVETRDVAGMLTSVGFSSPPAWLRPFRCLSNGEQFRCELGRSLLAGGPLVVFDEFTSVVDRTVAKIGSAAVAKAVRRAKPARRFVAVTCHYDVLDWLQPDWVCDLRTGETRRVHLQRPPIRMELRQCGHELWPLFARHHYLNGELARSAVCFAGLYKRQPVAFVGVMPVVGYRGKRRVSRCVVLPDWQGVGVGRAVLSAVGDLYQAYGLTLFLRTGHAGMIAGLQRDARWRIGGICRAGTSPDGNVAHESIVRADGRRLMPQTHRAVDRPSVGFRYVGAGRKIADIADGRR